MNNGELKEIFEIDNTNGDYFVRNIETGELKKLGTNTKYKTITLINEYITDKYIVITYDDNHIDLIDKVNGGILKSIQISGMNYAYYVHIDASEKYLAVADPRVDGSDDLAIYDISNTANWRRLGGIAKNWGEDINALTFNPVYPGILAIASDTDYVYIYSCEYEQVITTIHSLNDNLNISGLVWDNKEDIVFVDYNAVFTRMKIFDSNIIERPFIDLTLVDLM